MLRLNLLTPFRFRLALAALLGAAFIALQLVATAASPPAPALPWQNDRRLHVFVQPECPHCHAAVEFLKTQPSIDYVMHDVSAPADEALLLMVAAQHNIPDYALGVPLFVRGPHILMGFESAQATGRQILALAGEQPAPGRDAAPLSRVTIPLIGEIELARYSLSLLAIIMGLTDGLNPCAMWVLVYLISLIAAIHNRGKIWSLASTFVFASGVLYFLFMTAWLNAFLFVGYIRPLTQLIALAAMGFGADHLFELAVNRGVIICKVGSIEQRQRTMNWIRTVVAAPVGLASLALIIGLAFIVNAVEFVCSAALPAVYTHILALTELSSGQYYGYILLYVAFFMLDDLVVLGFAAFAINRLIDTRFAAVSRLASGVIMIGLGVWMLLR